MEISSKTIRDFAKATKAIFPEYEKNPSLSLGEWRDKVQTLRDILMTELDKNNKAKASIDEEYSPNFAASRKAPIDAEYAEMVELSQELARREFTKTVEVKRDLFRKAMQPPTDAQLRLLQVLNMRQHVKGDEISFFAESLADNLLALRCLGDIAKNNGVAFPPILDADDLERMIREVTQAAEKYLTSIGTSPEDLTYEQRLFWGAKRFRESKVMETLDKPGFMQVNAESNQHEQAV